VSGHTVRVARIRSLSVLALMIGALALAGCSQDAAEQSAPSEPAPAAQAPAEQERPPVVKIEKWVVNVVDDDSYSKGDITYSIALNLTASNPSQDAAGTYTGTATAKTDTVGSVGGQPLNASAIAESSKLEFTLEGATPADDPLAPLDSESQVFSGGGAIVMEAAGSGTIGPAGGSFENTSGQNLQVSTQGSKVTLKVAIDGHTYTFDGTLTPVEE